MLRVLGVLICITLSATLMGQQTKDGGGKIWLSNSKGHAVGAVVGRNFFDAEWVDIRTDFELNEGYDCFLIIIPEGGLAMAIKPDSREIDKETLSRVFAQVSGAKVLVVFQPKGPNTPGLKKNKLEIRLL